MLKIIFFIMISCLAAASAALAEPVRLGVFPYISPSQMVSQLTPLQRYLEKTLAREIEMLSAPDFMSFVERTAHGDYDLVITAPHMGRLAQQRDGWQLVVMSGQQTATVILVPRAAGIKTLKELRGGKMAVGNWRSVTCMLAKQALAEEGLTLGVDVEVIETATFSNVVSALLHGEVEAGATPTLLWDQWAYVNEEQRRQLHELFRAPPPTPHSFLVMAPPTMAAAEVEDLRRSLLAFGDTPAGRKFFVQSQYHSFLPPDEQAMALSDPFVHVLLPDATLTP
ncbi:phosphate/phosphite/phosphonate ABC transporter substrate-binding protein [Desulfurivibrio alkaliphilus]|uniref:ABC transport system periplasmic component n=1 Tax=Desulfurivibrio alkaliphilus (strain DSM 19089 / UNIQEM U267 / AHT2) TaxID=589865 RepID=D6Z0W9_DESAT|nr:phosphate/phosphite/phosphonate ABC transporter substrate-binding protein [Desulfurivibrio alkaliphilus]ADH87229.1 ABC transport system periplasmic component [Desulfurivibrio alkaliphilus AHT 2]